MKRSMYVALASLFAASGVALAQMDHSKMDMSKGGAKMDISKGGESSHQMMQMMTQGMDEMNKIPMSGDIDRDFARMMKKHHEVAVRMAQMEIDGGKDAKMKSMAQKMMEDQKREIRELDDFLKGSK